VEPPFLPGVILLEGYCHAYSHMDCDDRVYDGDCDGMPDARDGTGKGVPEKLQARYLSIDTGQG